MVVSIEPQDAADQAHIIAAQQLLGLDLNHADRHPVGGQWKVGHRRRAIHGERLLAHQATVAVWVVGEQRQGVRLRPQRIGRRRAVTQRQVGAGQPALRAFFAHASIDRHGLRPQNVLERTHKGHVQDISVAKAGQVGQVLNDSGHVPLPKQSFFFFPGPGFSSVDTAATNLVNHMGTHIARHQSEQFFF